MICSVCIERMMQMSSAMPAIWGKRLEIKKEEPSFADLLTTLRRVSYEENTARLLPDRSGLKAWIAQLTELLSRAG